MTPARKELWLRVQWRTHSFPHAEDCPSSEPWRRNVETAVQQPAALVRARFSFPDLLEETTLGNWERLPSLLTCSVKVPFSEIQNTSLLRGNIWVYNCRGGLLHAETMLSQRVPRRYVAMHEGHGQILTLLFAFLQQKWKWRNCFQRKEPRVQGQCTAALHHAQLSERNREQGTWNHKRLLSLIYIKVFLHLRRNFGHKSFYIHASLLNWVHDYIYKGIPL